MGGSPRKKGNDVNHGWPSGAALQRPGWSPSHSGEWMISPSGRHRIGSSARSARGTAPEVAVLRAYVELPPRREVFEQLEARRTAVAVGQLLTTWALIIASWALCVWVTPWAAPLALIIIGTRQRALGNQIHNASHGGVARGAGLNRHLIELLACWASFEDFEQYRLQHLRHHAHLGDHKRDPDYLDDVVVGQGSRWVLAWRFFKGYGLSRGLWKQSMLATLPAASAQARLRMAVWWAVVLAGCFAAAGVPGVAWFAGLWLVSRATVYHLVKVFAELSDHIGLVPGTIASYTRNLPDTWASFFFHPHSDNYHLAHHLFPKVPLQQLPRLHRLLVDHPIYKRSEQCQSYFFGERAVIASWVKLQGSGRSRQNTTP